MVDGQPGNEGESGALPPENHEKHFCRNHNNNARLLPSVTALAFCLPLSTGGACPGMVVNTFTLRQRDLMGEAEWIQCKSSPSVGFSRGVWSCERGDAISWDSSEFSDPK